MKKKHVYSGLQDKNYFYNLEDEQLNNLKDYKIEEVESDGNCGYRALSLQIYNDENSYNVIRTHVYTFLNTNLDFYKEQYTTLNNEAIKAEEYIPHVKTDGFWMGILNCLLLILFMI